MRLDDRKTSRFRRKPAGTHEERLFTHKGGSFACQGSQLRQDVARSEPNLGNVGLLIS
jgi:hypothetical protein